MELVRYLQYLLSYTFAEHARNTAELRVKGLDEINLLIGNSILPTLLHRMSLVLMSGTRLFLFI